MNANASTLRWIGRIVGLSLSRAMEVPYVKVTAAQDDRTTGEGRARRARADRLERALASRRLHLRAARHGAGDWRRAGGDAGHAAAGRRRLGARLLGADPVHAPDGADH